MNVLLISPGYPAEMPLFTRGLAEVGARVFGVGDQPKEGLAGDVREALSAYLAVRDLWDEEATVKAIVAWVRGTTIDRVECLWEPGMILAAKVREALRAPGLTVAQTIPFRDKVAMKDVLAKAGVRVPRHARARTANECREIAESFGYPLIIKPVAGAGSDNTFPLHEPADLERALGQLRGVPEVTVEEFVVGEEHTFDTICADGRILYENIAWYRPTPLDAKLHEWISATATVFKEIDAPELRIGRELGRDVLKALGFQSGFTHMEWFRNAAGEAVFGEIGARPPGARLVHLMNYSVDADLFRGWAEAVCFGRLSQDVSKKHNVAVIFKRARGQGVVRGYQGLDDLVRRYGPHVKVVELTPIGSPRRDWKASAIADGWIVVRHDDLQATLMMADAFASQLTVVAS